MDNTIETAIIILVVIIIISFLVREVTCWYWKINESIDLQKQILAQLQKLELKICDIKSDLKNELIK